MVWAGFKDCNLLNGPVYYNGFSSHARGRIVTEGYCDGKQYMTTPCNSWCDQHGSKATGTS